MKRARPVLFRLSVQTDYNNGHPRNFADELRLSSDKFNLVEHQSTFITIH